MTERRRRYVIRDWATLIRVLGVVVLIEQMAAFALGGRVSPELMMFAGGALLAPNVAPPRNGG